MRSPRSARSARSPRSVALLTAALVLLLAAPAASAGPKLVEIRALSYAPARVAFAAPGRAVRWRNVTAPDRLHDVVSSLPGYFDSGLLGTGQTYTFRFDAAGTFGYICSIHDVMLGRVEVAPVVAVEGDGSATWLRVTMGTHAWSLAAPYRWSVFVRGPGDAALAWRRVARAASVRVPVDRPGDWTVMVRLRHRSTGNPSADSPLVTVTVPA